MAVKKLDSQFLTFEYNNEIIKDIECNIEVEDESHWNKIIVTTGDNSILKFQDMKDGRITIPSMNLSGDSWKKTEFLGASIRELGVSWGNVTIIRFAIYPKEVFITQSLEGVKRKRVALVNYYINKAPMFAPWISCYPDEHGNVKQKKGNVLAFETADGNIVHSDTLFTYFSKNGHFESDQYQLLTTKVYGTKSIIKKITEEINPHIEDIMLMMSFLQDSKVHSVNWRVQYSNKYVWHYKSNNFKADDIDNLRFDELVERVYVKEFMDLALKSYHDSAYRDEIKNSISSLSIRKGGYVELTYLSFFQALESLILAYKRNNGLEFILDKDTFKSLRRKIEKTIKAELEHLATERGKIKNKLIELNRLSLKESAEMFMTEFNIKIDDAWPLFDDKARGITGLSTIRNVLIHGDLMPSDQLINIAIALEHLRIILSRCIFCLLGWDVSRTKISEQHLLKTHNLFAPEVRDASIGEINEYFNKKDS